MKDSSILTLLLKSKQSGTSIGIESSALSSGIVITTVEELLMEDGRTVAILKHFDNSGVMLPVDEIDAVYPFSDTLSNLWLDSMVPISR